MDYCNAIVVQLGKTCKHTQSNSELCFGDVYGKAEPESRENLTFEFQANTQLFCVNCFLLLKD